MHILTGTAISAGGCNFSGAFAAALMTALRLAAELFKAVPETTLHQCLTAAEDGQQVRWPKEHLNDPCSLLQRINRAALVVETYMHGGSASGYGTLGSLFPSSLPFLYFRESPLNRECLESCP